MSGEIITIGDELLYGHGVHTNSAYLGERLTSLGIEVKYKSIVGDAVTHIVEDMA
jgi:nicotinamide-nucleotide amidase